MHRHRHADRLAGREALEIDMLRRVGHRVELHVADQRARCVAVDLDLVEARLPAGPDAVRAAPRAGPARSGWAPAWPRRSPRAPCPLAGSPAPPPYRLARVPRPRSSRHWPWFAPANGKRRPPGVPARRGCSGNGRFRQASAGRVSRDGRFDIRASEVLALEQQPRAVRPCAGIGEAVTHVQCRRMSALAELYGLTPVSWSVERLGSGHLI